MITQKQYCNEEVSRKIDELLSQMTVDEKIGQLHQLGPSPVGGFEISLDELKKMLDAGAITQKEYEQSARGFKVDEREDEVRAGTIGSFLGLYGAEKCNRMQKVAVEESRLGIPLLLGFDVIHGLRTVFPIPLAESCSWDLEMAEKTAAASAKESAAVGLNWTFAPMVDIARDARWGRIAEGAGEDTYHGSRFAEARVKGFQGESLADPESIAACAKHFVAYGAAIGGRDYNTVDMSLQTLYETYLPPFKAATDAGVATFMGAFNDLNGVPCSTNPFLYKTILRKDWGFNGMVVSDSMALQNCLDHATVADRADVARQALQAGMDMDMHSTCYHDFLKELLENGQISMADLDAAVTNVLRIKFALGLFENPYTDEFLADQVILCDEHRALARESAKKSIVLLKNNGVLPLKKNIKIAVVGALADNAEEMLGTWEGIGRGEDCVSVTAGLQNAGVQFAFAPCCSLDGAFDEAELSAAIKDADVVIACVGESKEDSGEASARCDITLPGRQDEMLAAIRAQGKKLVTVLFNGRPLAIPEAVENSDAVVEAWHLGVEAGNAVCDVLFGDYNPSARLTTTFPNRTGECPTYYNHLPTGKPAAEMKYTSKYIDAPLTPLFPFGYGLSYTEYAYSGLSADVTDTGIDVTVTVKNVGAVDGEETVQVYVHDVLASRSRPVRELKAFGKVFLKAGEEKQITLTVARKDLEFYDMQLNRIFEAGDFEIFVGHDSTAPLSVKVAVE